MSESYTEANIKSLDWKEHIRLRPGMYIGKLGDGSTTDDGIYILLKEVIDNSIDEFVMGYGKVIELTIQDAEVRVRDYGRGIPLGKLLDCASKINTGAKYDSEAFKKSVGLNGVGIKAVNALSFKIHYSRVSWQGDPHDHVRSWLRHPRDLTDQLNAHEKDGTCIEFVADTAVFGLSGLVKNS